MNKLIFFAFFSFNLHAGTSFVYQVSSEKISMREENKQQLLLSENCFNGKNPRKNCEAWKVTRKRKNLGKLTFNGGENPGALICKAVSGEVVWGHDSTKNQVTLCRFKDGTLISTGSLTKSLFRFFN